MQLEGSVYQQNKTFFQFATTTIVFKTLHVVLFFILVWSQNP